MIRSVILYFGSFNPIHCGHLSVAEYVVREKFADEIWLVVSPNNPLKDETTLIDGTHRLRMTEIAVASSPLAGKMKVCDLEFELPKPSYTIDTLDALKKLFPTIRFSILRGGDIVEQLPAWKQWRRILSEYPVFLYPRDGFQWRGEAVEWGLRILEKAPHMDISSSEIRERLYRGEDVATMLPDRVYEYIKKEKLWERVTD